QCSDLEHQRGTPAPERDRAVRRPPSHACLPSSERPPVQLRLPALARPSLASGPPEPSTWTATPWSPQLACAGAKKALAAKIARRLKHGHLADRSIMARLPFP